MPIKITQISFDLRHNSNLLLDGNVNFRKDLYSLFEKHNLTLLGDDYIDITDAYKDYTTTEWCQNCDTEVLIKMNEPSNCPECGKHILPCSMCQSCSKDNCPFK